MSYHNGPRIITNGLALYLDAGNSKSYPGTGSTWTDLSGNNNNGTLTNGPTFSSENKGSIIFDGSNDHVILNTLDANLTNNTFSFWIKFNAINRINTIIGGTAFSYYQIRIDSDNAVQLVKSGIINMGKFSNFSVVANRIYNIVVTRASSVYSLYVNGSYISALNSTQTFTTTQPTIGRNALNAEYLNGSLFSMFFYNTSLSPSEIQQNYNATKGRFNL